MRKISSFIMACAMCLSMTVVGTVAPQVAVQAEETATVELKEAPTTVPAVALDSDLYSGDTIYTLTYSVNEQNWIEAITSVEVNNQVYTKVSYSWDMGSNKYQPSGSSYNVKIGKQAFTVDVNKVVISAQGYKKLILEVNKNGKTVAIHTKHTGGTATCTKKAVCEFCGEEYGDLKKEDPKPADKTTESKKDDTKPAEKPDKKTVKAKKVVVNKKRIVLKKGKKVKLKAKLKPANATEKVTFKSSNKKVAKVTKNGVVKAVKKGKCKITVKTASGKKAVVKVTVK